MSDQEKRELETLAVDSLECGKMTRSGSLRDINAILTYVSATPTHLAPDFITHTVNVSPVLTVCLALPWVQGTDIILPLKVLFSGGID